MPFLPVHSVKFLRDTGSACAQKQVCTLTGSRGKVSCSEWLCGEEPRADKKHLKAAEWLTRVRLSCAGETILGKK